MLRSRGDVYAVYPGSVDERHKHLSAYVEVSAGRLAALEVSGATPTPTPCSSGPAILGMQAASRRSGGPAPHEARTLLGAGAQGAVAPVSFESQFAQSHQKPMCLPPISRPCRSTRKAGSSSGRAQKRTFTGGEVGSGSGEYIEVLISGGSGGKGSRGWAAVPTCSTFCAPITSALELPLRRTRRECGRT